eukprot:Hpha_TRINITY_DN2326_c1_g1::TRINITY_DN2326_c1_g1_i1::g.359::m.359
MKEKDIQKVILAHGRAFVCHCGKQVHPHWERIVAHWAKKHSGECPALELALTGKADVHVHPPFPPEIRSETDTEVLFQKALTDDGQEFVCFCGRYSNASWQVLLEEHFLFKHRDKPRPKLPNVLEGLSDFVRLGPPVPCDPEEVKPKTRDLTGLKEAGKHFVCCELGCGFRTEFWPIMKDHVVGHNVDAPKLALVLQGENPRVRVECNGDDFECSKPVEDENAISTLRKTGKMGGGKYFQCFCGFGTKEWGKVIKHFQKKHESKPRPKMGSVLEGIYPHVRVGERRERIEEPVEGGHDAPMLDAQDAAEPGEVVNDNVRFSGPMTGKAQNKVRHTGRISDGRQFVCFCGFHSERWERVLHHFQFEHKGMVRPKQAEVLLDKSHEIRIGLVREDSVNEPVGGGHDAPMLGQEATKAAQQSGKIPGGQFSCFCEFRSEVWDTVKKHFQDQHPNKLCPKMGHVLLGKNPFIQVELLREDFVDEPVGRGHDELDVEAVAESDGVEPVYAEPDELEPAYVEPAGRLPRAADYLNPEAAAAGSENEERVGHFARGEQHSAGRGYTEPRLAYSRDRVKQKPEDATVLTDGRWYKCFCGFGTTEWAQLKKHWVAMHESRAPFAPKLARVVNGMCRDVTIESMP